MLSAFSCIFSPSVLLSSKKFLEKPIKNSHRGSLSLEINKLIYGWEKTPLVYQMKGNILASAFYQVGTYEIASFVGKKWSNIIIVI